jgi:hypothetical protein
MVEINEKKTIRIIYTISDTKNCFLEKINKIEKSLAKLRDKEYLNKVRDEIMDFTTDTNVI